MDSTFRMPVGANTDGQNETRRGFLQSREPGKSKNLEANFLEVG